MAGPTPMMAQYLGIKSKHPDAILLFRMGDFYETFYEDAELVSRILGITLTSREKKGASPIPLAGVPYHALDHYLAKLLDAGCTIAICEQVEDPSQAKGLVKRDVVEIVSPGTVTNPGLLRNADNQFLLALSPSAEARWGYAFLDGSTGEFSCGEASVEEALSASRRPGVTEVLLPDTLPAGVRVERVEQRLAAFAVTRVSSLLFETEFARQCLLDHFGVHGLEGLGVSDLEHGFRAAGAALRYLADRQRTRPTQVRTLAVERSGEHLHLDRETVAHLELFEAFRGGDRTTTVFHHLDETATPMGRRCLARWLRAPLCDPGAIAQRQDAVGWLIEQPGSLAALRDTLKGVGDLERIAGRIATGRVMPHELGGLRDGLTRVHGLVEIVVEANPPLIAELADQADVVDAIASLVRQRLVEKPPTHLRNGGIFGPGVDDELDRLHELTSGGKRWVASYQEEERARTGIPSLKVGYNKVFGYYLEVTNTHLGKVPDDYQEKQTLAAARRFVTPTLKERERQILRAEEDQVTREAELFRELVTELGAHLDGLAAVTDRVGRLDTLSALGTVARARQYVRPEVDDSDVLDIEAGRHLVVERIVEEPFVPNDLLLNPSERQLLLLTGPNMGGKSTYLRQAAQLVILAQMGCFVPARRARVGIIDRVFTRVGASDNLARGQSTFLVEMAETANILRHATPRSLVILDEVGRGTSTDDGLALAWAITEYLHDGPVRPKTLFATHFHQLTSLADSQPRMANIQMEVKEWEGEILFLHRVIPGASDRSYGVHVAKLAGVPEPVLRRAEQLLDTSELDPRPVPVPGPGPGPRQLSLFQPGEEQTLRRLRQIDPDQMRPIEALRLLSELVEGLD